MRNRFVGAIAAFVMGAGLAWGQGPAVIPPPLSGIADPNADPAAGGGYPPPANWDGFDLNGNGGNPAANVPRFWFGAEYMVLYPKATPATSPLLNTSSQNTAGLVNTASSRILVDGGAAFNNVDGFRFVGGFFLDAERRLGIQISGFGMDTGDDSAGAISHDGTPLLSRPFINSITGQQGSLIIASPANNPTVSSPNTPSPVRGPGIFNSTSTTSTNSTEGNFVLNLFRSAPGSGFGYNLAMLGGFRYGRMLESTDMNSNSSLLHNQAVTLNGQTFTAAFTNVTTTQFFANAVVLLRVDTNVVTNTPVNFYVQDSFKTKNEFYGGNLGLFQELQFGRLTLSVNAKLGIGSMQQIVDVNGSSRVVTSTTETTTITNTVTILATGQILPPTVQTAVSRSDLTTEGAGGLYAQSNNTGRYTRDKLTTIPEVNINLGFQITPALSVFAGYTVIYMPNVIQPNTLIDGRSNPTLQPYNPTFGAPAPVAPFNPFQETKYWLQGINIGACMRF